RGRVISTRGMRCDPKGCLSGVTRSASDQRSTGVINLEGYFFSSSLMILGLVVAQKLNCSMFWPENERPLAVGAAKRRWTMLLKPPLPPMETRSVEEIPADHGWQYEPKWDGFRCIAFRNGGTIYLQ